MTPRLYLVSDRSLFKDDEDLYKAIRTAFKAGLKAVQLREKTLPAGQVFKMANKLRAIAEDFGACLFINERVDIALCVGAEGVHLGQSGIPVSAARKIASKNLLIAVSTHSVQEALEAETNGADFITYGPVYQTPSKMKYGAPVGLDSLREAKSNVAIPLLGIGGINLDNAKDVISAGADGIAMIRGILSEKNIDYTVKKYLSILGEKQ